MSAERSLTVRRAGLADVDVIVPMMIDFNELEAIRWTPEAGRPVLEHLLGAPELGMVLIATDGDVLQGYAVVTWGFDLEFGGRDSFLTELYLVPAARGRGAGRALLAAVERAAYEAGALAMHLMVRFENAPAMGLYRSAGFEAPPRALLSKRLGS